MQDSLEVSTAAPSSVDAERSLIAAILATHGEAQQQMMVDLINVVSQKDVYDPRNRLIYAEIETMASANMPIDTALLAQRLRDKNILKSVGGSAYIDAIASLPVNSSNHIAYAGVVSTKSRQREVIQICQELMNTAITFGSQGETDVSVLYNSLEKRMLAASQSADKGESYKRIGDAMWKSLERAHTRKNKGQTLMGLPTGIDALDMMLGGLQVDYLSVFAARPSVGKTSLVMDILGYLATEMDIPVAFFSLEMTADQLADRFLAKMSKVKSRRIKASVLLEDDEWESMQEVVESHFEAPLYIDDRTGVTLAELCSRARRLVINHGVKVIGIDYLQLLSLKKEGRSGNPVQEVGIIAKALKALSTELHIHIMVLSQLSRAVEKREGKRPDMSDIRESGDVEAAGDQVVLIFRQDYYDEQQKEKNPVGKVDSVDMIIQKAELIVAKNRDGEQGMVKVAFVPEISSFTNIEVYYQKVADYNENFNPNGNTATVASANAPNGSPGSQQEHPDIDALEHEVEHVQQDMFNEDDINDEETAFV